MSSAVPHDSYAALRRPSFRWFILTLWAMTLGTQIQAVVVGWQIYALTHDPLSLGMIGLAEALPFISFALYGGHIADRFDRKRVSLIALSVLVLCSAALLVITLAPHPVALHRVWPIYAVIFASGIARSFYRPASMALSAELVPVELYPNAVTWRTSTWQSAAVIGPALGGLLYGFFSAATAYAVDVALMAISLVALTRIFERRTIVPARDLSIRESLVSGLRFVWNQPVILGAMTLDLFSVLFGGATALLPIFASEILHVGPEGLGILRAAPAVGSVGMAIVLAHRPPLKNAGRALFTCVALFGVSMIGFGMSRNFWLSLALLAFSGMVDNVSIVVRSTLLQVMTPHELLGRVASVNQIFVGSSNEIGAFESGVAARLLGTVPSVVLGGALTLVVVAITAASVPQLRRLRELRAPSRDSG